MVLQQEPGWEDQQLARYLLGELSDEEADRIDEASISDETLAWRLRDVEDELVDAYVGGRLSGDDLQRFKWFYLSSERRRDRVRFAEALQHMAGRTTDSQRPVAAFSNWRWLYSRSVPFAWGVGMAAALMLVGCGALLQQDVNLRQALHSMQAESATLERRTQELLRQLATQRSEAARAAQDLAQARASLEDVMDHAGSDASGAVAPRRTLPPVSLLLLPQARSAASPATLTLPREATWVALQLQLEFDDFRGYRIAIEDPRASRVVWRSERIPARTARGGPTLSVLVPARKLASQLYAVELVGVGSSGADEVVGSYSFRVQRP